MQSAEIVQDLQRLKVASSTDGGGRGRRRWRRFYRVSIIPYTNKTRTRSIHCL